MKLQEICENPESNTRLGLICFAAAIAVTVVGHFLRLLFWSNT